ncbi:MAG: UDP-2,4-diacetamido-2,4,6-trideoxy-beta-L-altropyranose hydrolase [Pelotomaculum sp. PtaB.Bin104]|nr:MAG: UDP-2,4-diacetamido-2,4,6-trideoxy-beta-L-altropyranose hydrolase [Pelotomaculum sp. PtaB.Bin104]
MATQLSRFSYKPVFIMRNISDAAINLVRKFGFEIKLIAGRVDIFKVDCENEFKFLDGIAKLDNGEKTLIVDHYGYHALILRECKKWFSNIVVIDDYQPERCIADVDIVINPNISADTLEYVQHKGQILLLGSRYAILREQFTARVNDYFVREQCYNIAICFGACDTAGMIFPVLHMLSQIGRELSVTVIVGADYKFINQFQDLGAAYPHELVVKQDVDNVADLLLRQDLLIMSPSSIALEAMALGVPSAFFICENNQRTGGYGMRDEGIACYLGEAGLVDWKKVRDKVKQLINNYRLRLKYSLRSQKYVDGKGALRVAGLIHRHIGHL